MAANDEMKRLDAVVISGSGASAVVGRIDIVSDVPSGGTIDITENGVYDVTEYSEADVQVEGIVPAGTKNITEDGSYDVTQYATANVNVGGGSSFQATIPLTLTFTTTGEYAEVFVFGLNENKYATLVRVAGSKTVKMAMPILGGLSYGGVAIMTNNGTNISAENLSSGLQCGITTTGALFKTTGIGIQTASASIHLLNT